MKKTILIIIILYNFCLLGNAQVSIGIRDSRYACIGYTLKNCYVFRVEQSLYTNSKLEYQYIRCNLGAFAKLKKFFFETDCYWGTAYNRSYQNLGAFAKCNYNIVNWLTLCLTLNPHYDTYFGLHLCTEERIEFRVLKDIDFLVSYSSIPEYRQSEHRIKAGLNFHVKDYLWVKPVLSFPLTGAIKNFRILIGFGYTFKNYKKNGNKK